MFFHPLKVPVNGFMFGGTEKVGNGTVGMSESGWKLFIVIHFAHVGPHFEVTVSWSKVGGTVMKVSLTGTITFDPKPTLITAYDFAGQCGRIGGLCRHCGKQQKKRSEK